jgi:hypothetical protein
LKDRQHKQTKAKITKRTNNALTKDIIQKGYYFNILTSRLTTGASSGDGAAYPFDVHVL